eukprot:GEMP01023409.1.p1 GENE.GEMP01023409.1~~GEMP01023409.1.p1  ORF type:complete len:610 (+),score=129.07 GEMP01023409.1:70-1899(+)
MFTILSCRGNSPFARSPRWVHRNLWARCKSTNNASSRASNANKDTVPPANINEPTPAGSSTTPSREQMHRCARMRKWDDVTHTFRALLGMTNVTLNAIDFNVAMNAHAKTNDWRGAFSLLASMKARRVHPTVVSYNTAMSACKSSRRYGSADDAPLWHHAVLLLRTMKDKDGLLPNVKSYSACITACEKGGNWQVACRLLHEMQESTCITPNTIAYSACISVCAVGRAWDVALQLLEKMQRDRIPRDVIAYSSAITACQSDGQWMSALHLLDDMQTREGLEPNTITFNAAIAACAADGQWVQALSLLRVMTTMTQKRARPDVFSFSAAISACEKGNQWRHAVSLLLHGMPNASISPNVISYSAAISACARAKEWLQAMQLFNRMVSATSNGGPDFPPDVIACNAMLSACEKSAQWEYALSLLDSMTSVYQLQPTRISINAAISACDKGGRWEYALALFHSLRGSYGLSPDLISYQSVIGALDHGERIDLATRLYREAVEDVHLCRHWQGPSENLVADFHDYTLSFAKCAIRVILEDLASCRLELGKGLTLICGKGLHSSEQNVLMPEVQRMLSDEFVPPLEWQVVTHNSGRIVVSMESIRAWIRAHTCT